MNSTITHSNYQILTNQAKLLSNRSNHTKLQTNAVLFSGDDDKKSEVPQIAAIVGLIFMGISSIFGVYPSFNNDYIVQGLDVQKKEAVLEDSFASIPAQNGLPTFSNPSQDLDVTLNTQTADYMMSMYKPFLKSVYVDIKVREMLTQLFTQMSPEDIQATKDFMNDANNMGKLDDPVYISNSFADRVLSKYVTPEKAAQTLEYLKRDIPKDDQKAIERVENLVKNPINGVKQESQDYFTDMNHDTAIYGNFWGKYVSLSATGLLLLGLAGIANQNRKPKQPK